MKDLIIPKAVAAFKENNFTLAIQLYEAASKLIGKNLFEANITLCKKRLSSLQKKSPHEHKITDYRKELHLTKSSIWERIPVSAGSFVSALANVEIQNGGDKSGVALIRFIDEQGNFLDGKSLSLPQSDIFGSNFVYLKNSSTDLIPIFQAKVPTKAKFLDLGFCLFQAQRNTSIYVSNLDIQERKAATINTSNAKQIIKRPKEFKVAMIADEFTTNSFSAEFIQIPIEPDNWREMFEKNNPDIFFCESAWSGPDSNRRPWKGQIYASVNFKKENRTILLEILDYCRQNGIPTIFWNKEDPTHYTDRVNDFVKTAKEFDFVFTSAAECIEGYKREYNVNHVFALPFATNPRLFNPVESSKRSSNIVFAGSWYGNHKERSETMESILDLLQDQGFRMEIYDRYYGSPDLIRKWPDRYKPFINPAKPHSSMPEVYKSSRFGLNFNTVTESSTMFARRVFELMSSNTFVISNYSRGMSEMFGNLAIYADKEPERLKLLSDAEIDTLREQALTLVLREHTYAKRWCQILSAIGIPYQEEDKSVTVVSIIYSREDALLAINWFQQYGRQLVDAKLLLVIGAHVEDLETAKLYQEFNRFGIAVTSISHATKYALADHYHPVVTPYFALIDPKTPPLVEWLEKATLHLQYMNDYAIAPAGKKDLRYRIAASQAGQPLVGNVSILENYLKTGKVAGDVYYV